MAMTRGRQTLATTKKARSAKTPSVVDTLNHHVALAADLRSQVKQAHWNVVGPNFIALHHLFDDQAEFLLAHVDLFAERVRALRGVARGTVRMAATESPLKEISAGELPSETAVRAILDRFEVYSGSLAMAIKAAGDVDDSSTEDIYIEAQRQVDLHAYFLRSHLGIGGR
ncbi:MAG: DNA starvation/stationary phase protection protein Dps [Dehalococcoidia bacterium]|nr:MAG: DNA starvation/stationary phase protection protein Dps [Dehalococcoidia bacterium]